MAVTGNYDVRVERGDKKDKQGKAPEEVVWSPFHKMVELHPDRKVEVYFLGVSLESVKENETPGWVPCYKQGLSYVMQLRNAKIPGGLFLLGSRNTVNQYVISRQEISKLLK